ncbi:MAG: hypothetical protein QNJ40_07765 [Xanthomonadales bacterium]|nr:hypothetical protein [Xanthomonadales bacterium]
MQLSKHFAIATLASAISLPVHAQTSEYALRFYGSGVGPPGQQDRVLLPLDDDLPGPAGHTPVDIGSGGFTLEWWMRGRLSDNDSDSNGGDVERFDYSWINAHIIFDRDVWCGTERSYGVSIAGGLVQFGNSSGDAPDFDSANTIEGSTSVLDDQWHHVAVVRDAATGTKHIYVDGVLDFSSSAGVSFADLSYPDDGVPVTGNCGTGQLTPYGRFLVFAAEKHDAGAAYPSYAGYIDEVRLWATARSARQIADNYDQVVAPGSPGLVGYYRFEEGSGTVLGDSSDAGSPDAQLIAGIAGNGEWVSRAADPDNTAPLAASTDRIFSSGFEPPP